LVSKQADASFGAKLRLPFSQISRIDNTRRPNASKLPCLGTSLVLVKWLTMFSSLPRCSGGDDVSRDIIPRAAQVPEGDSY